MAFTLFQQALNQGRESETKRLTDLYQGIWAKDPNYGTDRQWVIRTVQDRIAPHIQEFYGSSRGIHIVDFGAGDGRFLRELLAHRNEGSDTSKGTGVDFHLPAKAGQEFGWYVQPLWDPIPGKYDYAISCDTLEHLPEWAVPDTLRNIRTSAPHGFLRIATRPDTYGTKRGLRLHETVRPPEWWTERLSEAGITPTKYTVYCGHAVEYYY